MKYFLVAGEKSGDLHASNLMKELKKVDPAATFRFFGGEEMEKVDSHLLVHYREMAFMGFLEVIQNLFTIKKYLKLCKEEIAEWQPDRLILVDYAGFNLRIAAFAKKKGIPVHYYISPKVWAWNPKRALKIKKNVDFLYSILPFEKAFFQKYGFDKVFYVGNPLFDAIRNFTPNPQFRKENGLDSRPIIALLPGSRKQEVINMLPKMLSVVSHFPDYQFVVAGVTSLPSELYQSAKEVNVPVVFEQSYQLLNESFAGLVTSGTATLETALFEVPQVVCYQTSHVSYHIAKWLITVPYISLVNLVAEKEVVKELIQGNLNTDKIQQELSFILSDSRERTLKDYEEIKRKLYTPSTSETTAKLIFQNSLKKEA